MSTSKKILPLIIISQFLCTSLWFAGNSIINDLVSYFNLSSNTLSYITSSVQLGFISGTLIFALLAISDKFSPSKIFFLCAVLGGAFNLGILVPNNNIYSLLIFRFLTGFALAGIYPIGMKIAADYFDKGLGKSLGWLVGALVLGTAFPHLIKLITSDYPWQYVIIATSTLAIIGGCIVLIAIKKGPYFKKNNSRPNLNTIPDIFKNQKFSQAAIGYFGHMWELYAFWAFVPLMLESFNKASQNNLSVSLYSFIIIGLGSLSCIISGFLSERFGLKKTATYFLIASGICCCISPFIFDFPSTAFITFLSIWGFAVIGDSPLFSTLIAKNTAPDTKGTALTIVNCIGFSITIVSIQLLSYLHLTFHTKFIFLILAIGPIIGSLNLLKKLKNEN